MPRIIATDSCHSQQLILAAVANNLQPMVANTKKDFADRLNLACTEAKPPISLGRGRRAELRRRVIAKGLVVSGESVRKWLSAESIPSMDNVRFIAIALNVEAEWLLTGRRDQRQNMAAYDLPASSEGLNTNEPPTMPFSSPRQRSISEIISLLEKMSDTGIAIVRDKAKDMAAEFPLDMSQTETWSA